MGVIIEIDFVSFVCGAANKVRQALAEEWDLFHSEGTANSIVVSTHK